MCNMMHLITHGRFKSEYHSKQFEAIYVYRMALNLFLLRTFNNAQ